MASGYSGENNALPYNLCHSRNSFVDPSFAIHFAVGSGCRVYRMIHLVILYLGVHLGIILP